MKNTTKKLLTWLYSPHVHAPLLVKTEDVAWLLPELSPAGLRSLLTHLVAQDLIFREEHQQEMCYRISQSGVTALSQAFPAFSPSWQYWQGGWSCLVFLSSPKSDPQFRYLRTVLIKEKARALSRGVFIYPGSFTSEVLDICHQLYRSHVAIFGFSQWVMGDERSLAISLFALDDIKSIYSGISKEIKSLLTQIDDKKGLTHQQKSEVRGMFERLLPAIEQDPGFLQRYFPGEKTALDILASLQQLYFSQVA